MTSSKVKDSLASSCILWLMWLPASVSRSGGRLPSPEIGSRVTTARERRRNFAATLVTNEFRRYIPCDGGYRQRRNSPRPVVSDAQLLSLALAYLPNNHLMRNSPQTSDYTILNTLTKCAVISTMDNLQTVWLFSQINPIDEGN